MSGTSAKTVTATFRPGVGWICTNCDQPAPSDHWDRKRGRFSCAHTTASDSEGTTT